MANWLVAIVIAHIAAGFGAAVAGRRRLSAAVIGATPLAATLVWSLVAMTTGGVLDGLPLETTITWLPALGVAFDVRVDALSLLFLTLVSGIGLVIVGFSYSYMAKSASPGRFIALLILFAGAMSGLVVIDNVYGFFVFWELTTITSYLLVGFDDRKGSARAAALQAILTTGLGGLALLGGLVMLAQAAGTTSIAEIVADPPDGRVVGVALLLVFAGAFTKSAQAPFHFWLPGAMSAPTPASAYLHSATMVKAGIFLLLLLAPGFSSHAIWTPVVLTVGIVTMLIGAWRALRQTDLKLLLAYGTVSQLGLIVALVGIGSQPMRHAAIAMVLGHALFKSALFLTVGAIDSAAGTRDIRVLSGMGRYLPVIATAGGLAAASMAGLPPLAGFVSKEVAFDALINASEWAALGFIAVGSIMTVAYSARFWWGAFAEHRLPDVDPSAQPPARPGPGLMLPPLVLALAGLVIGIAPQIVDRLVSVAAEGGKLVLWPGWKPALAVSAVVAAAGAYLHIRTKQFGRLQLRVSRVLAATPAPSAEGGYRWTVTTLNRVADRVTGILQNGSLPVYLAVILSVTVAAPTAAWLLSKGSFSSSPWAFSAAEVVLAALAIASAVAVTRSTSRMVAVLLLGSVGYAMAGVFAVYGAPDLALTLLLVETITVAVYAFVLAKLPRTFEVRTWRLARALRIAVAAAVGGFVTVGSLIASQQRTDAPVSDAYAGLAPEAGGTNVVNVILTDFRSLDTLGEVTVVAVAAIGVAALVGGLRAHDGGEA
jgi:multicomponent Na+:H+ antiporter subunit A